jgi:hypothetical protein
MNRGEIKKAISDRLKTAKDCDFKRAWIPKGWSVIRDNIFIDELANDIQKIKDKKTERKRR